MFANINFPVDCARAALVAVMPALSAALQTHARADVVPVKTHICAVTTAATHSFSRRNYTHNGSGDCEDLLQCMSMQLLRGFPLGKIVVTDTYCALRSAAGCPCGCTCTVATFAFVPT